MRRRFLGFAMLLLQGTHGVREGGSRTKGQRCTGKRDIDVLGDALARERGGESKWYERHAEPAYTQDGVRRRGI